MPPRKSIAKEDLMRAEGLERTDNNLSTHSWPVIPMINQKNYYTEYLKRDDQIMVLREQQEEAARALFAATEKEKTQGAEINGLDPATTAAPIADSMAVEDANAPDERAAEDEAEARYGRKIIVIHPGSQNLRLGFASDALPNVMPNVIAKKAEKAEFEVEERIPKRAKLDKEDSDSDDENSRFLEKDPEFDSQVNTLSAELKQKMRSNKRRMLPNSKELVLSFNRRAVAETIKEHNDPHRVEWTDISKDEPMEYYVGHEALRIPDTSNPRYRLFWPIRHGWLNERDYSSKRRLIEDIQTIIEEGLKTELGLEKKELVNYRAVLVVPDLYERHYVIDMVDMLMREIRFAEICIIQESVAASFGAGFSQACIVDVGAQKTSICCVEEGMCVAESRVNIRFGGRDVTEAFLRMILQNSFPYKVINIWRRYDFLLAEELKTKYATMNDGDISVQAHEFHLRRPEKDTKKYSFRTYDEVMLAPMTHFKPSVLSHSHKLAGRQSLWPRSYDIYDNSPNDPVSSAQIATYTSLSSKPLEDPVSTPARPLAPFGAHLNLAETTPHSSVAGSPGLEGTPNPGFATPDVNAGGSVVGGPTTSSTATANANNPDARALQEYLELRDRIVPVVPLDQAVIDSIWHAAKGDEKRTRDFYSSIMVVGGGSSVPGFNHILENRIRNAPSNKGKDIHVVIGMPPRELDTQVIAWKGASVFGKLRLTNDSWIRQREYDILGSRLLTHKCMWNF